MNSVNITNIITQKKRPSILTIGDAMIDVYLQGDAQRICREAPVPIVNIKNNIKRPGGAANTAVNLANLNVHTYFLSVIGWDREGEDLKKILIENGTNINYVFSSPLRKTMAKRRVAASDQLLVRFDSGSTEQIQANLEGRIIDALINLYPKMDAIVVSDYGYGILTPRVIRTIAALQDDMSKILIIDSKYPDRYTDVNATVAKPNYQEAVSLLGLTDAPISEERVSYISKYKDQLHKRTGAQTIALTVDVEGSIVFEKDRQPYRTFTKPVENSKAVGAGDTFTSAFALALALGAVTSTAAEIATAAATVVAHKEGTATCDRTELLLFFAAQTKSIKESELALLSDYLKLRNKTVVFTNGCFDILHSGHVEYLNRAKQAGDILIVGINSDASVRKLKGKNRPVNTLTDRVRVLSALSSVDYVIPFSAKSPISLIELIKPDIYVKGGDYTLKTLPEVPHVKQYGGKIELIPLVKDKSTTNIIKRVQHTADASFFSGL